MIVALSSLGYQRWRSSKIAAQSEITSNNSEEAQPEPTPEPTNPTPEPEPTPAPTVFYPIPGYAARITERAHGQYFELSDGDHLACGGQFSGYHAGDDLETTAAELEIEVPIYAIADGTVKSVGAVGGYGGLLVLDHVLNGEAVTAYYGHIDVSQTSVKVGDKVTAGQQITYLGDHCSSETSGQRKHIHFAIHKGATRDVRGYIQNQSELSGWHNPKELLASLGAAEPK